MPIRAHPPLIVWGLEMGAVATTSEERHGERGAAVGEQRFAAQRGGRQCGGASVVGKTRGRSPRAPPTLLSSLFAVRAAHHMVPRTLQASETAAPRTPQASEQCRKAPCSPFPSAARQSARARAPANAQK